MQTSLFYIFSVFIIALSLISTISRKPFVSVVSFGGMFVFILGLLVLMHASFVGLLQLFVWGGFVTFLFLSAIMALKLREIRIDSTKLKLYRFMLLLIVPGAYYLLKSCIALPIFSEAVVDQGFGGLFAVSKEAFGDGAFLTGIMVLVLLVSVIGLFVLPRKAKEEGVR